MSLLQSARDAQPAPSHSSSTSPPELFRRPSSGRPRRSIRIGVIGDGRVARAFTDLIAAKSALIAERDGFSPLVTAILARNAAKPRSDARVACDPAAFFASPFDVVVDAAGDAAGLLLPLARLLGRGVSVVTASKELVASAGPTLADLARSRGVGFGYEASVAAGLPLFRVLDDALRTTRVARMTGILNGTANFVVGRLGNGVPFADAVREAQALGLAEPDPAEDLSGRDAARKLTILAWRIGGCRGLLPTVIRPLTPESAAEARATGRPDGVLVYAARLEFRADGEVLRAEVGPEVLAPSHPLAGVRGAENGLVVEGDVIDRLVLRGPGAGPVPTAAALLDDVILSARLAASKEVA